MRELAGEMNEGRSVDGVAVDLAPRGACTGRGMFASWKKTTSDGSSVQGSCCGWLEVEVEVEVEVEKGIRGEKMRRRDRGIRERACGKGSGASLRAAMRVCGPSVASTHQQTQAECAGSLTGGLLADICIWKGMRGCSACPWRRLLLIPSLHTPAPHGAAVVQPGSTAFLEDPASCALLVVHCLRNAVLQALLEMCGSCIFSQCFSGHGSFLW